MPPSDAITNEAAVGWLLRLRAPDASGTDWVAFTDWLAADPANAEAYDALALADADAATAFPASTVPWEEAPTTPRRRLWLGRAAIVAAAVAAAVAVIVPVAISQRTPAGQTVSTVPGERRTLKLADGTMITLNGGTKLIVGARRAVLTDGEALFSVAHDPRAPFEVLAGDTRLRDLGTVFNVKRTGGVTEVAVAAGAVVADPEGVALRLSPGDRLRDPDGTGRPELSHLPAASVGGWRDGRLSFSNAAIADVASDLARSTGLNIAADPRIAERRFTGTIVIDDDRAALRRRLPQLLDVAVAGTDDRWQLTSR